MSSHIPPEVHALTWLGYIAHIMHMVSCIAMPSASIRHALCECLLFAFYIRYVNYAMPCFSASYHICELCTAMEPGIIYVNYLMPSFFSLRIPFVDNLCILNYSSCVSAIWAGYGKIWSENKVFRAGNGTCWSIYLDGYRELLRGGFRDRWPVLYPTWGVCSKLQCLYFSYDAYGVLHCLV